MTHNEKLSYLYASEIVKLEMKNSITDLIPAGILASDEVKNIMMKAFNSSVLSNLATMDYACDSAFSKMKKDNLRRLKLNQKICCLCLYIYYITQSRDSQWGSCDFIIFTAPPHRASCTLLRIFRRRRRQS